MPPASSCSASWCSAQGRIEVLDTWGLPEGSVFDAGCDELVLPIHREAYANCTVLEARPCYDVARLMFLDAER